MQGLCVSVLTFSLAEIFEEKKIYHSVQREHAAQEREEWVHAFNSVTVMCTGRPTAQCSASVTVSSIMKGPQKKCQPLSYFCSHFVSYIFSHVLLGVPLSATDHTVQSWATCVRNSFAQTQGDGLNHKSVVLQTEVIKCIIRNIYNFSILILQIFNGYILKKMLSWFPVNMWWTRVMIDNL